MLARPSRLSLLSALVSLALLTGCQATQVRYSPSTANPNYVLNGHLMGGEQPITAATIQIYAVNTTTTGGPATPLLNTTVTTSDGTGASNANANAGNDNNQLAAGSFTIAATDFECPSSTSLLYIVAVGGNTGTGTNSVQENIAGLGACGSLPSTVVISEISTVGTVRALSSYMTAYNAVGATTAQASALTAAFTTINEYVDIAQGTAPGPSLPTGYYASSNDLRALANVVQSCVDTTGSTANGSTCGTFFADARGTASATPGDTVTALLDIFADPTNNVSTLFNLQGSSPAFAPTNAAAPPDWTLPILQVPSTPVISPPANTYAPALSVTITDADTDATDKIYYTTDGSTPSATNGTLYSGAITVSSSETVNAIAVDDSRLSSAVASAAYTINPALTAPTDSLASLSANYGSTTGVTLTATSNAAGSVVTFGTQGSIGGTFSPATCTITGTTCSVTYTPSGTLAVGAYTNDLTASFGATATYGAGYAGSTLTISPAYGSSLVLSFTGGAGNYPGDQPQYGNLIQGSDGNFYGTTYTGGAHGYGVVFKVSSTGTNYSVLHAFAGGTGDGEHPYGSLVQGSDGNFYGTTLQAGAIGAGTIFEINSTGSSYTVLHSFAAGTDGEDPYGSLVQGSDGNFYGMTAEGGSSSNDGTVFKLVPNGTSSTVTVLHAFAGGTADGQNPYGSLVQGSDGNFYGMTNAAGAHGDGIIFEVNATTSSYTVLHSFAAGAADGANPFGSLVQGSDGNFYGITDEGGSASSYGTVFKLVPNGTSSTVTVLHSFAGGTTDGASPRGSLVQGSDGNFYGMSAQAGSSNDGTVFKISSTGTNYTVLHAFAGGTTDGRGPAGSLVQGSDGNFYGMTYLGGSSNDGTIFKLAASPALAAPVTLTAPSSVSAGGSFSLTYAVSNVYVASPNDGTLEQCFAGVSNSSDAYTRLGTFIGSPTSQTTTFTAPSTAGTYTLGVTCGGEESSTSTLTVGTDTAAETPNFSPGAGTYTGAQTVYIYSDTGASIYYTTNGTIPTTSSTFYTGPITVSASGTINAIASGGGYTTSPIGSAFYTILDTPTVSLASISAPYGSTTPVTLTATSNAAGSVVTFGATGSIGGSFSPTTCTISGTTCSVMYTPSGTLAVGTYANDLTASFAASGAYGAGYATSTLTITPGYAYTVLHSFGSSTPANDGRTSFSSNLIQGTDGNYYGTTQAGGVYDEGTVFELVPNGVNSTVTILYSFAGGATDGAQPYSGLVQGSDGNLYGLTFLGGPEAAGTAFEILPNGVNSTEVILHSFLGSPFPGSATDGAYPQGTLVQGEDGNFYGMTGGGGSGGPYGNSGGVFFEIQPNGINSIYTQLHGFGIATNDGAGPSGTPVQGTDGNFYGFTGGGGANGDGTFFQLIPDGTSSTVTTFYSFTGSSADGANPYASPTQYSDGNFYGSTAGGGISVVNDRGDVSSYGTVLELVPNGTSTTDTVLHSFTDTGGDGENPRTTLTVGSDGYLYGTASFGGSAGYGMLYQLVPNGTSSVENILHTFTGGTSDGDIPSGSMMQGSDGNFYGMTYSDGANGYGIIYELAPSPALSAPITISLPSSVDAGAQFKLTYKVANAFSGTMQTCFAGIRNSSGAYTELGTFMGKPTSQTTTLPAPSTTGTYTLGVTCGGQESSTTTLTVQ